MKKLEALAATVFGVAFLVLAVAVTAETIMRKVFNQSLQGVDELGGYILALAGAMSFSVALVARAHIRIDIVHDHLPAPLRVAFNVLASLSILACAVALLRMAWFAYDESAALGIGSVCRPIGVDQGRGLARVPADGLFEWEAPQRPELLASGRATSSKERTVRSALLLDLGLSHRAGVEHVV